MRRQRNRKFFEGAPKGLLQPLPQPLRTAPGGEGGREGEQGPPPGSAPMQSGGGRARSATMPVKAHAMSMSAPRPPSLRVLPRQKSMFHEPDVSSDTKEMLREALTAAARGKDKSRRRSASNETFSGASVTEGLASGDDELAHVCKQLVSSPSWGRATSAISAINRMQHQARRARSAWRSYMLRFLRQVLPSSTNSSLHTWQSRRRHHDRIPPLYLSLSASSRVDRHSNKS